MRHPQLTIFILLISTIYSCSEKPFPESKFIFSDKYSNLIRPYKAGDTLLYKNNNELVDTFVITRSESKTVNTSGHFPNQRAYKNISISYNQLPTKQWTHEKIERDTNNRITKTTNEDNELISINIYPDNGKESCTISFKNFRGKIIKETDQIIDKPIFANGLVFNKYYKVENVALDLVKYPTDLKSVYITEEKGIIAYQDQEGHWWTRLN